MPVVITLLSSGSNAHGQLANGTLEDSHVFQACLFSFRDDTSQDQLVSSLAYTIRNVACGANHTLALLERRLSNRPHCLREIWGCGDGSKGQLGPDLHGVQDNKVLRRIDLAPSLKQYGLEKYQPKAVAANWETSFVVLECSGSSDVLVSMGSNDYGNLGSRHAITDSNGLHIVSLQDMLKSTTREGLPEKSSIIKIDNIATGMHHNLLKLRVMNDDQTQTISHVVAGWGRCRHGQIGIVPPTTHTNPITFVSSPVLVQTASPSECVISMSAGGQHSILLEVSGTMQPLGSNRKLQLNHVVEWHDIEAVTCSWNGTYALRKDGKVLSTGSPEKGQLGRDISSGNDLAAIVELPIDERILKIVAGSEHVLAVLANPSDPVLIGSEVWGWGWNEHGNLGLGHNDDVHRPTKLWPSGTADTYEGRRVVGVWAGCGTSWIAVESDEDDGLVNS